MFFGRGYPFKIQYQEKVVFGHLMLPIGRLRHVVAEPRKPRSVWKIEGPFIKSAPAPRCRHSEIEPAGFEAFRSGPGSELPSSGTLFFQLLALSDLHEPLQWKVGLSKLIAS